MPIATYISLPKPHGYITTTMRSKVMDQVGEHARQRMIFYGQGGRKATGYHRTGNWARSIRFRSFVDRDEVWLEVGPDMKKAPYAWYLDRGIGIFGPKGQPYRRKDPKKAFGIKTGTSRIRPYKLYWADMHQRAFSTAKLKAGETIFTQEIKGYPGKYYIARTQADPSIRALWKSLSEDLVTRWWYQEEELEMIGSAPSSLVTAETAR